MQEVNSRTLRAEYCIVGIPHNTAVLFLFVSRMTVNVMVDFHEIFGFSNLDQRRVDLVLEVIRNIGLFWLFYRIFIDNPLAR